VSQLNEFGSTAKGLSKNPLGIIALFIVLIYGFVSLVVGLSGGLEAGERQPIIWFMVFFPILVLLVFALLVVKYHKHLYAPSDYKDENLFVKLSSSITSLDYAKPIYKPVISDDENPIYVEESNENEENSREEERDGIYKNNRGIFLAHVLEPSAKKEQEYDIFIYLVRHKVNVFNDIETAHFYLGSYWDRRVFKASINKGKIGMKTSAFGPFLCTCHVKMKDGKVIKIHRYIDFEMGMLFRKSSDLE